MKYSIIASCWLALGLLTFSSCNDEPDKYESTSGNPEVKFIRLPESADSIITESFTQRTICLVGNNLKSIRRMFFNDKEAVLNTSYITNNTLLVDVPSEIPSAVTDKIYMINEAGDTTTYDFHVSVPSPSVMSMSCEYAAAGDEVTITGDYFIQDPYKPLQILFNDGTLPVTDIKTITKNSVTFTVPAGATTGRVLVQSVYGKGESNFVYKDTRNIIFDFDGSHGGMTQGNGWRAGVIHTGGIDGSYLYFGGASMLGKVGATWDEDHFAMNYWPEPASGFPEISGIPSIAAMLDTCNIADLVLKFECRVPAGKAWSASALQVMLTSNANVTLATGNNQYCMDPKLPRGLWLPWQATGSFETGDKWVTVTMPLTSFTKTSAGQASSSMLTKDHLKGLTLFVWDGGIEGVDCTPELYIDNIRLVPVK